MHDSEILIVEDSPTQAVQLQHILEREGYRVACAARAEEALDYLDQNRPSIIVTDVVMPGMDGYELCRRIKGEESTKGIPVLLLTLLSDPKHIVRGLEAGAADYVTKPFNSGEVIARVRNQLRIIGLTNELAVANEVLRAEVVERQRAENRVRNLNADLEDALAHVLHFNAELEMLLDRVRVGSIMTEKDGKVTYVSTTARRLIGREVQSVLGMPWPEALPIDEPAIATLEDLAKRPLDQRERVPVQVVTETGRRYWLDIEVQDDPRDSLRKILFMYDMTEVHALKDLLLEKAHFHNLVGKSKPMTLVYEQIQEVASVDWTVLIEGETGTGKELVARAIHTSSHRGDGPFIAVNCAGLSDSLLASQLFGHRRGAFTGAVNDQDGVFEAAAGGTLFLDEIGDISPDVQRSLLRVLEQKEITRVGESKPVEVDTRVLVATNRDLIALVEEGGFRADLFYRIRIARITLPPLRGRREDIPLLAAAFLGQCQAVTGKAVHDLSQDAMRKLLGYEWPGNVRELKSAIEVAVTHCKGAIIQAEDLPPEVTESSAQEPTSLNSLNSIADEKERVLAALAETRGNRAAAARLLGISRATFYRRLGELEIQL